MVRTLASRRASWQKKRPHRRQVVTLRACSVADSSPTLQDDLGPPACRRPPGRAGSTRSHGRKRDTSPSPRARSRSVSLWRVFALRSASHSLASPKATASLAQVVEGAGFLSSSLMVSDEPGSARRSESEKEPQGIKPQISPRRIIVDSHAGKSWPPTILTRLRQVAGACPA